MMRMVSGIWLLFVAVLPVTAATGKEASDTSPKFPEATWGVAMTLRTASIPYDTSDDSVSSVVPMLFFDGEHFFLEGLGGGVKLWQQDNWHLDLLGRMRFVDVPRDVQNEIQADTIDFGGRLTFSPFESFATDLELMSDDHSRMHANLRFRYIYQTDGLELAPLSTCAIRPMTITRTTMASTGSILTGAASFPLA